MCRMSKSAVAAKSKFVCKRCGQRLPEWTDIAAALECALETEIPDGLRPMLLQAIYELRERKGR